MGDADAPGGGFAISGATDSRWSGESLIPGTQYLIQVRACGNRGSSDWSNAVTKYEA
jgi:hypothetical protein